MMFLSRLIGFGSHSKRVAREILASVSGQARMPVFYGPNRIADTVEGRTEMILLHAILVLRRLRALNEEGRRQAQVFHNVLFDHLEYGLREAGAGDFTIGRKMRTLGEGYLGRARAYDVAIPEGVVAVRESLLKNMHDVILTDACVGILADYVMAVVRTLDDQDKDHLVQGKMDWPEMASAVM